MRLRRDGTIKVIRLSTVAVVSGQILRQDGAINATCLNAVAAVSGRMTIVEALILPLAPALHYIRGLILPMALILSLLLLLLLLLLLPLLRCLLYSLDAA